MSIGHDFNFEGGEVLSKIAAWWFVSYAYYNFVDNNHLAWQASVTLNSLNSRRSKYNTSLRYHKDWLNEVLKMEQLDKHKNSAGLTSSQIKDMAKKVLQKI